MAGSRVPNHLFIRRLVIVPAFPLLHVRRREFPVLLRIVQPLQKSLLLLFLRNIQENFSYRDPVSRHIFLKRADIFIPVLPEMFSAKFLRNALLFQYFGMHPHHQHLFVVGPVEDSYLPPRRQAAIRPPQKIMRQFFARRLLERMDLHSLRIHAGHHVLDRAVLSRRVHPLKNQQQPPIALCVELVLHFPQQHNPLFR